MKIIIAATDFSETSGAGLREARKFAQAMKARILLVFVQNTTDIRYALGQEIPLTFENSRGLSPLKTFFLGSTTQNLIRTSPCPVVVIHKSKRNFWKKEAA